MKIKGKKLAVLALAAAFLSVSISSLAEEIESRKLSIIQVTGDNAYIKKGVAKEFKAIKGMSLGQGNQVGTREDSTIYIEADDDKVIRLDEKSLLEISKASAKSLKLTLRSGNVFFNVDKPLDDDEEMVFEAAQTSMSIRGTSGVFTYNPLKMEFYLVEGSVSWDIGDGQIVELKAGESIKMERDLSNVSLGPAAQAVYTFTHKVPFQWTDLDDDSLEAVMENRAQIDLSSIGLDTPDKIKQASDKVEEYKKSKETVNHILSGYSDDNDDDYYEEPSSTPSVPETTEDSTNSAPSVSTDSNADSSDDEDQETEEPSEEETEEVTDIYYTARIDGPTINNGTYDLRPGENGTYFGMIFEDETWYWKWARYNDTYGTFVNDEWQWNSEEYPESFEEYGLNDLYFLYPAEELEALIPTE